VAVKITNDNARGSDLKEMWLGFEKILSIGEVTGNRGRTKGISS